MAEQQQQQQQQQRHRHDRHSLLLLCAFPPLPRLLLPKLPPPQHRNEIQRFFSRLTRLHSLLFHALHDVQHSLCSSFPEALARNPFLFAILPPQFQMRRYLQVRDKLRREHRVLSSYGFAAILPGDSVAAAVVSNGIFNFLNIYNTLLIARLILTWFPNPPQVIVNPLSALCDPYLNIFRGLIPPLGGTLDFSPILAFLVLNAFTNTAAALPAELPSSVGTRNALSARQLSCASKLTWIQKAWLKRHATFIESQEKESYCGNDEEK